MNQQAALNLIEDALDLQLNSLTPDMQLTDIAEYDSMGKLNIIVVCDEEFDKKLTGEQMREFKTVSDLIEFMLA